MKDAIWFSNSILHLDYAQGGNPRVGNALVVFREFGAILA